MLAFAAGAPAAHAQTLEPGAWSGVFTLPSGENVPVTFDVAVTADSISITLHETQMGAYPFRDIRLDGDRLRFRWTPGSEVACDLTRAADGHFEGPCTDGEETGKMTMLPPEGAGGSVHDTRH
ncbi:MAG TPA: hypothetical protein VGA37_14615 [Gemmatimonadales bacterium]